MFRKRVTFVDVIQIRAGGGEITLDYLAAGEAGVNSITCILVRETQGQTGHMYGGEGSIKMKQQKM